MKKLKCISCSEIWYVEDIDLDKQNVCPFCAEILHEKIEFKEYDSLDKAIYSVINRMGKEVLQNSNKLIGLLMDIAPNLKKEIRIFSRTVCENHIVDIKEVFEQEKEVAEKTINKLKHILIEEEGLSDSWADIICQGLFGAIMYTKGVGISSLTKAETIDFVISDSVENQGSVSWIKSWEEIVEFVVSNSVENKNNNSKDKSGDEICEHFRNFLEGREERIKCNVCGCICYEKRGKEDIKCPICGAKLRKVEKEDIISNLEEGKNNTNIRNSSFIEPKGRFRESWFRESFADLRERFESLLEEDEEKNIDDKEFPFKQYSTLERKQCCDCSYVFYKKKEASAKNCPMCGKIIH